MEFDAKIADSSVSEWACSVSIFFVKNVFLKNIFFFVLKIKIKCKLENLDIFIVLLKI